jgi:hypothetical protein
MLITTKGIAASERDEDYSGMAYIYCVDTTGYCLSLSRQIDDPLIEVMVIDQVLVKTAEVAAELSSEKLMVRLSDSAANELDGNTEYVVPLPADCDNFAEIDAALAVIFAGVGQYTKRF